MKQNTRVYTGKKNVTITLTNILVVYEERFCLKKDGDAYRSAREQKRVRTPVRI